MHNNEWKTVPVKYLIDYSGTPSSAPIKNMASPEKIDNYYPAYSASGQDVWLPNYMFDCDAIVISAVGARCGKTFLAKGKFGVCANTHVLKVKKTCCSRFLNYILNDEAWWIKGGSAQPFVKVSDSLRQKIVVPDLEYQMEVADFLDDKCAEIDKLSEGIQKQIDILNDYKKSVITRAVTKGLDPNAEMKDSGIEYIGEVPTKWNIHPIYYYFDERRRKNSGNKEQNLLSLSYGHIIRKDINTNGGLLPASFSTYNIVYKNDIIIRPTDLQNDKRSLRTGLVTERGIITSAYIDLRPLDGVNSEYYHYLLHAYDIMKVFYNMGNGVRQGLNYSEFSKLLVLEPSSEEQRTIVSYLNDKCEQINSIIAAELDRLNELQSYKKSIIYEYVTGKKRVKGEL